MSTDSSRKVGGLRDVYERRKHRRYDRMETGKLWVQGVPVACTVIDGSARGALVETSHPLLKGARVELEAIGLGRQPGEVVRTDGSKTGLRFDSEITPRL